jgi:hypothetical protein
LTLGAAVRIVVRMKRLLALVPMLVVACSSLESNARSDFARQNSCPEDRVTIAHAPPRRAPPEVAADPGRLAVWNDNEAKRSSHYYVASGCGHESLYLCEHRPSPDEAGLPNCMLQQSQ